MAVNVPFPVPQSTFPIQHSPFNIPVFLHSSRFTLHSSKRPLSRSVWQVVHAAGHELRRGDVGTGEFVEDAAAAEVNILEIRPYDEGQRPALCDSHRYEARQERERD